MSEAKQPEPQLNEKANSVTASDPEVGDTYSVSDRAHTQQGPPRSRWQRIKDSFKPLEASEVDTTGMTELEAAVAKTAQSSLNKSLKNRHLQMIAIGGAIGTGLFIGSGGALQTGGPAALLIGWGLVGTMIFCTVHAIGELAVHLPISGSINVYSSRFIDPSWGFTMGWNYAMQWIIVLPLELVAASIVIQYWNSDINPAAWVGIFYVLIVCINFFGVKGYGEAEFVFSTIKVVAVIGFIILGIIINCGGAPKGGYLGGLYWQDPGAFANGFKGVCGVFVTAAFSFSGSELVGLAAVESENPRKHVPRATKQVFWRITLFYMISLTLIGLLVPYTNESLGTGSYNAAASPFVIAIKEAGIGGLPSVVNVVILIAVLSVGNSSVYGASRTMVALAAQGFAPKFFGYIDRKQRPLGSTILVCIVGLLCFTTASDKQGEIFTWLLALSGLSSIFTWGSVCFAHVRFRHGFKAQGRNPYEELAFTSQCGVIGSWYGVILNILILIAQFWIALFPIGEEPEAKAFFEAYLAFPVIMAMYIFHKVWKKNWSWYIRAEEMDLDSGRVVHDLDLLKQEIAEEKAYIASQPLYYRVYRVWC